MRTKPKTGHSKTANKPAATAAQDSVLNSPYRGEFISRLGLRIAQGRGGRKAVRGPTQDLR